MKYTQVNLLPVVNKQNQVEFIQNAVTVSGKPYNARATHPNHEHLKHCTTTPYYVHEFIYIEMLLEYLTNALQP